jgi:hypothetical protein
MDYVRLDEVHWYLRIYHPDNIIDGDNCAAQKV